MFAGLLLMTTRMTDTFRPGIGFSRSFRTHRVCSLRVIEIADRGLGEHTPCGTRVPRLIQEGLRFQPGRAFVEVSNPQS